MRVLLKKGDVNKKIPPQAGVSADCAEEIRSCTLLFIYSCCKSTNIWRTYLFSAIFGLVIFGRKLVAAEILFCKVQCDSVYRQQQYRPKVEFGRKRVLDLGGRNLNGPKIYLHTVKGEKNFTVRVRLGFSI